MRETFLVGYILMVAFRILIAQVSLCQPQNAITFITLFIKSSFVVDIVNRKLENGYHYEGPKQDFDQSKVRVYAMTENVKRILTLLWSLSHHIFNQVFWIIIINSILLFLFISMNLLCIFNWISTKVFFSVLTEDFIKFFTLSFYVFFYLFGQLKLLLEFFLSLLTRILLHLFPSSATVKTGI